MTVAAAPKVTQPELRFKSLGSRVVIFRILGAGGILLSTGLVVWGLRILPFKVHFGRFRQLGGTLFWGPYNKDPTI